MSVQQVLDLPITLISMGLFLGAMALELIAIFAFRAKGKYVAKDSVLGVLLGFMSEPANALGTVAERYLVQRAIVPSLARSSTLRFHARMTSLHDRLRRPALLAAIVDGDGALQGVQVTLLSTYGSAKAHVATPRRVIGRMMGGAVRLAAPEADLAIAEGVESAASAAAALDLPTWALLSAHNLALFTPPPTIKRLVVALDNDPAGRAAFDRLRHRMSSLCVVVAPPRRGAKDWNDWARMTTR